MTVVVDLFPLVLSVQTTVRGGSTGALYASELSDPDRQNAFNSAVLQFVQIGE